MLITDPLINWIVSLECMLFFPSGVQVWKISEIVLQGEASTHVCLRAPDCVGPPLSTFVFSLAFDVEQLVLTTKPSPLLRLDRLNIHYTPELVSAYFRIIISQSLFRQPLASLSVYISIFSWALFPGASKATSNHEIVFIILLWDRTKST